MKRSSLGLAVVAVCLGLAPRALSAPDPTPDQLIDRLAQIDCNAPGLYEYFPFDDFWAVVPDLDAKSHLEGPKPDCVPDAMRALVRLGPQALAALIRHIEDRRPTRLRIGTEEKDVPGVIRMGGQEFADEYESRLHVYDADGGPSRFLDKCKGSMCFTGRGFEEPYTIRVGDVCFTLIGQIVNRTMVAARYQMTGFVIVNSPIETPSLARRVRADWAGVEAEGLKNALLTDLRMPLRQAPPGYKPLESDTTSYAQDESLALQDLYAGALRRLRFYFPDVYESLSGGDLIKRQAFEKEEAERKLQYWVPDPDESIGKLTAVSCPLPGADDEPAPVAFLAEENAMEHFSKIHSGQYGNSRYPLPCDTTPILNIMHFGLAMLPALVRHLDDKRPTRLVLGRDTGTQLFFSDEYDARHATWPPDRCATGAVCRKTRPFEKPYTVRVGDLCFVLIGQIVNRQLRAVRSDAGTIMVNSPVETPLLADRVRADWAGIDDESLKNALLADLHAAAPENAPDGEMQSGALRRLRYYFPDTYASLAGADLEKRRAFEKAGRERSP